MNHPSLIWLGLLLACCPLDAQSLQSVVNRPDMDPIEAAIEAFNNRDRSKPNEIPVELEPPAAEGASKPDEAVLVTGKPAAAEVDISKIPVDPEAALHLPATNAAEPRGLAVRVQTIDKGQGKVEGDETIHLLAPFPAKPLEEAPEGWLIQSSESAPPMSHEIEIAPGKSITLTVRPHVLVPDADNADILAVQEPGFEASLGYRQSDTVSAVLSDSIKRLDEDSRRIGSAIDQLQQLIVSLPVPGTAVPVPDDEATAPDKP